MRESTGTEDRKKAEDILKVKEGKAASGEPVLPRVDRIKYDRGVVSPYLFPHLTGRYIGKPIRDFVRKWQTVCRKAGCPGMLRHNFRRTAVRNLVNSGTPERVAITVTGHKTRAVFDRYHIVSPADLQAVARRLAESDQLGHSRLDAATGNQ